jgi:hypothetical protein
MLYRKNSSPKIKKRRSSKVRNLPSSYHQVLQCVQNGRREEESEEGDQWLDLSLSSGREGGEKERKSEFPLGTERQLLPRQRPSRTSCEVRFNSRPNDSAHHSPSHSSLGLPPHSPSKKLCCCGALCAFLYFFNLTISWVCALSYSSPLSI